MRFALLLCSLIFLGGCLNTSRQEMSREVEHHVGTVDGKPTDLVITRDRKEASEQQTSVDLQAMITATINASMGKYGAALDALASKPSGITTDALEQRLNGVKQELKPTTVTGNQTVDIAGLVAMFYTLWKTFGPMMSKAAAAMVTAMVTARSTERKK